MEPKTKPRFFTTEGPIREHRNYFVPPLERFDLEEVLHLIEQDKYFVLHAPRQTGKTSCLLALTAYLNRSGEYKALYVNIESAQAWREDVRSGIRSVIHDLAFDAEQLLGDPFLMEHREKILEQSEENALITLLSMWAQNSERPLVLLIDEIDSLVGDTLISILRQLRSGYAKRPNLFPQSIILCGVRDVRDYRIHSAKEKEIITGGSAFNIKAESLRLGGFSRKEVFHLLQQHTEETDQKFEENALELIWELTQGQPWLVNALAYEVTFRMKANRDRSD